MIIATLWTLESANYVLEKWKLVLLQLISFWMWKILNLFDILHGIAFERKPLWVRMFVDLHLNLPCIKLALSVAAPTLQRFGKTFRWAYDLKCALECSESVWTNWTKRSLHWCEILRIRKVESYWSHFFTIYSYIFDVILPYSFHQKYELFMLPVIHVPVLILETVLMSHPKCQSTS